MDNLTDFWNQPNAEPPPGVTANFENPASRSYMIDIAAATCVPFIILLACLRLYTKAIIIRRWSWSDVACVLGFAGACSFISLTVAVVHFGTFGHHQWDYKVGQNTIPFLRLILSNEVTYPLFVSFIKWALLILYLEIFSPLRQLRVLIYLGLVATGLFYITSFALTLALCASTTGSQLKLLTLLSSQRCQIQIGRRLSVGLGAFNIISDIYLFYLPLPAVWSLQMPVRRKLGIIAVFFTGIIAVVCSMVSLAFRVRLNKSKDNAWDIVPLWILSIVEVTAGFIISCMPSAAAFYRHAQPSVSQTLSTSFKKFRSLTASHHVVGAVNENDQVELQSHKRSGRKFSRLPDDSMQYPITKTTEFNVSFAQTSSSEVPASRTGDIT